MTVVANRRVSVTFENDLESSTTYSATENSDAPGQVQIVTLANGNNTITVPTGGTVATACTIVKPTGNTTAITLKGVNGDTGIRLHDTDPDSISIDDGVTTFVINVAAELAGVRLIWS